MASKKISNSDIIGGRGVNLIERVVLEMGCLWYPTGGVEAGVDGLIEIRDATSGEVTNLVVQVQSKATTNQRFTAETDTSFEYLCKEKDLEYWLNGNAPVILVVSRPDTGEAYWASIKDRFKDLDAQKARKIFFDKARDRFDANARADIVNLAVPKDSGIYLAPPPKQEVLYSNLLGISHYAPTIYIARTPHRSPSDLGPELRKFCKHPPGEWVLADKLIYSFHDLAEEPWIHVCERGTLEAVDTDEFAFSDDDERVWIFVRLLTQCLREKLFVEHQVIYNKSFDYFHFRPSRDLSSRMAHYQSIEKSTSREVFAPHINKNDNCQVVYYRHSAFAGIFRCLDEGWYLEITPTYRYTTDGERLYPFYERLLSGLKRLENNQAVLGQVVMWASLLSRARTMFDTAEPLLEFGGLKTFDFEAGVNDEAWLKHEDPAAKEPNLEEMPLFHQ